MSVLDKFLRYVAIPSQSNADVGTVPTSEGQRELAHLLVEELGELGATDVHIDEHACVTARFPAIVDGPRLGFLAHLDTADVGLSPVVNPRVVRFSGDPIELGAGHVLDPHEHPSLLRFLDEEIVVTDGASVLGSDDKAAIASIMSALENLPAEHPEIVIAFVPDEEIGLLGAKALDLNRFDVDAAYTIDCEGHATIAYETFNAGSALVTIEGVPAHPMSAKGRLVNPNLVAHDLIALFDRTQTPECTEEREGYIWIQQIRGDQARCELVLNIRDHDQTKYAAKKSQIEEAVKQIRIANPRARIEVEFSDVYGNIADAITSENRWVITDLEKAVRSVGLEPQPLIMRGGTDGSYLSTQGILTPNIFTGGYNFHSVYEYLSVSELEKSRDVILHLMSRGQP